MVGRDLGHDPAPLEFGLGAGCTVGPPEGAGADRAGPAPDRGTVGAVVDEAPRGDAGGAAGVAGPEPVGALPPCAPLEPRPPGVLPAGPLPVEPPAPGPLP